MQVVLVVLFVFVSTLGLVLSPDPASGLSVADRARSAPVLDRPAVAKTKARLSGKATRRALVLLQVRNGRGWAAVRTVRADRGGRFHVVVRHADRPRAYRAVSGGRASVVRRVVPPVAKPTPATPPAAIAPQPTPPVVPEPTPPSVSALPEPPAPSDECGERPARADGSHWSCTLNEEFSGPLNTALWSGLTNPGTGDLCNVGHPDLIEVSGGNLRMSVKPTGGGLQCPLRADGTRAKYAGSWLSSVYKWSQQYGRFESRIKVQAADVKGLHEAFWLWPDTRAGVNDKLWPASGEIDIMETYSEYKDLAVPFLHYGSRETDRPKVGTNTAHDCVAPRGEWNTYALEWTADEIRIYVNDKLCLVNTEGASSMRNPFIINFTQLLGGGTNLYDGRAPLPATMEVDYVKVWE